MENFVGRGLHIRQDSIYPETTIDKI